MTTIRSHMLFLAFLSAFLLSGTVSALGATRGGMAGTGPGMTPDRGSPEKQDGKVPAETVAVFGVT